MPNDASTEQTPLLKKDEDKLPAGQILLLCVARLLEPIAFFALFTYCPQMIKDTGDVSSEKDVGYASGFIESIFSLTQIFSLTAWGKLSDRYGRKPALVGSLSGVGCAIMLFGFSRHIWQMAICRSLAGMFAGSVVTIRTAIAELSTPKTQARAFSWFAFATNLGLFFGPLVGGLLARPALQYPNVFGGVWLFEAFPYCLPGLFNGTLALLSALLMALCLKETLPPEEERKKQTQGADMRIFSILKLPGVAKTMLVSATFIFCGLTYTALLPLFEFTSIELGGLGFDPFRISVFTCIGGVAQSLWILLAFPPMQRRMGTVGVLRVCMLGWPVTFFVVGVLSAIIRRSDAPEPVFYASLCVIIAFGSGVSMGFTCVQMMANHVAPNAAYLGAMNGLSSSVMAFTRIPAPVLSTSLYATGVRWGHSSLAWLSMIVFALCQIPLVQSLPPQADSKPLSKNDEEQ